MPAKKIVKKATASSTKKSVKKAAPVKVKAKKTSAKKAVKTPARKATKINTEPAYPTFDVNLASIYTQIWCNFNITVRDHYHMPDPNDFIRAFFIPASDIMALANLINSDPDFYNGARAYLGMTPGEGGVILTPGDMKMFLVPTAGEPDALSGSDIAHSPETGDSQVYDFMNPCPSTCDVVSVLYHNGEEPLPPSLQKKKASKPIKKTKKN